MRFSDSRTALMVDSALLKSKIESIQSQWEQYRKKTTVGRH